MVEQVSTPNRFQISAKGKYDPIFLNLPGASGHQSSYVSDNGIYELPPQQSNYWYCKLRELRFNNEKYWKYYKGQPSKKSGKQYEVWPEHVEEVFWQEAIARHEPLPGRKKRPFRQIDSIKYRCNEPTTDGGVETNRYGRNEIIAKRMEMHLPDFWEHFVYNPGTDEKDKLPRKVISSHLQVLKGKFQDPPGVLTDNQLVLYWLGKVESDDKVTKRSKIGRTAQKRIMNRRQADSRVASTLQTNPMQPLAFHMYLEQEYNDEAYYPFTSSNKENYRQGDVEIESWLLPQYYPNLCHRRQAQQISCNIILTEAAIAWKSERPSFGPTGEEPPERNHIPAATKLAIVNTFVAPSAVGKLPRDCYADATYFQGNSVINNMTNCEVVFREEAGQQSLQVNIGSTFWVNFFSRLWNKIKKGKQQVLRHQISLEDLENLKRECCSEINSLTAVVEIHSKIPNAHADSENEWNNVDGGDDGSKSDDGAPNKAMEGDPQPLVVVHSSFKVSAADTPGQIFWRNLIVKNDRVPISTLRPKHDQIKTETISDSMPGFAVLPNGAPSNMAELPDRTRIDTQADDIAAGAPMAYPWDQEGKRSQMLAGANDNYLSVHLDMSQDEYMSSGFSMPLDPQLSSNTIPPLDPAVMAGVAESLRRAYPQDHVMPPTDHEHESQDVALAAQPQMHHSAQYVVNPWLQEQGPGPAYVPLTNWMTMHQADDANDLRFSHGNSHHFVPCVPSIRTTQGGFETSHTLQRIINAGDNASGEQGHGATSEDISLPAMGGSSAGHGYHTANGNAQYIPTSCETSDHGFDEHDRITDLDATPRHTRAQHPASTMADDQQNQLMLLPAAHSVDYTTASAHQSLHERRGQYHMPPVHTEYAAAAPAHSQVSSQCHDCAPYYPESGTSQSSSTGGEVILTPTSFEDSQPVFPHQAESGSQQSDIARNNYDSQYISSCGSFEGPSQSSTGDQKHGVDYYQMQSQSRSQPDSLCMSQQATDGEEWVQVHSVSSTPRRNEEELVFDPAVLKTVHDTDMLDINDARESEQYCAEDAKPQLLPSPLEI